MKIRRAPPLAKHISGHGSIAGNPGRHFYCESGEVLRGLNSQGGQRRFGAVPTDLMLKQNGGHAALCPLYKNYFGCSFSDAELMQ